MKPRHRWKSVTFVWMLEVVIGRIRAGHDTTAYGRDQWAALIHTTVSYRVPRKVGNFLAR